MSCWQALFRGLIHLQEAQKAGADLHLLFQMWNEAWDMGLMIDKLKRQRLASGSVNNPLKGCVAEQQGQRLPSLWELVPRV